MRQKIVEMIERNKVHQDNIWKSIVRNANNKNSAMVKENLETILRMENKEDILGNLL